MRALTLIIYFTALLISCTGKKKFNIVSSSNISIDTLELRLRYETFETNIRKNLLAKVDTSDMWKGLGSLSDTSMMMYWVDETANHAIEQFSDIFDALSTPNMVTNLKEDAIHFSLITNNYLELEISGDRLLFIGNQGKIKSKKIAKDLWAQASSECRCDKNDNIKHLIMTSQFNTIYRLDVVLNGEYQYCWKMQKDGDILSELLEQTDL